MDETPKAPKHEAQREGVLRRRLGFEFVLGAGGSVEVGFLDVDFVEVLPARLRWELGVSVAVAAGKPFSEFGGRVR
ncbi:hypothetical protein Droror1_Dr00022489 [Drosera rotundifolia]